MTRIIFVTVLIALISQSQCKSPFLEYEFPNFFMPLAEQLVIPLTIPMFNNTLILNCISPLVLYDMTRVACDADDDNLWQRIIDCHPPITDEVMIIIK